MNLGKGYNYAERSPKAPAVDSKSMLTIDVEESSQQLLDGMFKTEVLSTWSSVEDFKRLSADIGLTGPTFGINAQLENMSVHTSKTDTVTAIASGWIKGGYEVQFSTVEDARANLAQVAGMFTPEALSNVDASVGLEKKVRLLNGFRNNKTWIEHRGGNVVSMEVGSLSEMSGVVRSYEVSRKAKLHAVLERYDCLADYIVAKLEYDTGSAATAQPKGSLPYELTDESYNTTIEDLTNYAMQHHIVISRCDVLSKMTMIVADRAKLSTIKGRSTSKVNLIKAMSASPVKLSKFASSSSHEEVSCIKEQEQLDELTARLLPFENNASIALVSDHNYRLRVSGSMTVCGSSASGERLPSETFTVLVKEGGRVALRNGARSYLSATADGKLIVVDADAPGDNELFQVVPTNQLIGLKGKYGKFIRADRTFSGMSLYCDATRMQDWEQWRIRM
ncbi:hypothetical protein GPECTOR_9g506 [Gonium pectorale]|uniref:Fascin domain-containing protein n=1 Tax=Gonium pectorale TaxID=33097 RepID=A0A150GRS9_GONPE|nr:hypothetical protein GPECTOR_9g506 [Gonium pectorale]|eukprot:KXZ52462.1 hypothetical protein GPECTOR_9g506 [Gonium pectorale]